MVTPQKIEEWEMYLKVSLNHTRDKILQATLNGRHRAIVPSVCPRDLLTLALTRAGYTVRNSSHVNAVEVYWETPLPGEGDFLLATAAAEASEQALGSEIHQKVMQAIVTGRKEVDVSLTEEQKAYFRRLQFTITERGFKW